MKIIIDLEGDTCNTVTHGEATLTSSGTGDLVTIRLENPNRNVTFMAKDLLNAIEALR